ncbi:MAG: PH domain-containing protein [Candidatus Omnitrophota bacterium]
MTPAIPETDEKIYRINRPCSRLFWLYLFRSLGALIAFPVVLAPLVCKYISLRYHFDKEGVGASWGVFFRRQVFLTYARIQDIHVTRGLIERWLGLGTVDIQTASGSAAAELSIVGMEEFDEIRNFLYTRMRGARGEAQGEEKSAAPPSEALPLLLEIRDELRALRRELGEKRDADV